MVTVLTSSLVILVISQKNGSVTVENMNAPPQIMRTIATGSSVDGRAVVAIMLDVTAAVTTLDP